MDPAFDEPLLQDMHKVKEVMEQRRQRMTVNGNETSVQASISFSVLCLAWTFLSLKFS